MSWDEWLVVGAVIVAGAFIVWTKLIYEPKRDAKVAADTRLFEVVMARKLIETASDQDERDELLARILSKRPKMPTWPEWKHVWGNNDPLKTRVLH